ncbi:MAG TPA: hypothetical protein VK184_18985 [Nostocaceae cyanobacterium]|nr:hypothetical protein [Nostocaceae cyanobacterium]
MKFDWSNYLKLAQTLLDEVNTSLSQVNDPACTPVDKEIIEAKLRCLISRAYYSVFCLARNYLRDVEQDLEVQKSQEYDVKIHGYVMNKFRERGGKDYRDIGVILDNMRRTRNQVDYDDYVRFNLLTKAKNAVESANYAIEILKKLENYQK